MTVETFLAWKAQFDKELQALRSEKEREEEKNKKFTGRELFQKDDTLNESDLNFLGDGNAPVVLFVYNSDDSYLLKEFFKKGLLYRLILI